MRKSRGVILLTFLVAVGLVWSLRTWMPGSTVTTPSEPTAELVDEVQSPDDSSVASDDAAAQRDRAVLGQVADSIAAPGIVSGSGSGAPTVQELEAMFLKPANALEKLYAAGLLVLAVAADTQFVDYLNGQCQQAATSGAPEPLSSTGDVTPEFEAWAASAGMPVEEAMFLTLTEHKQAVYMAGVPQDVRFEACFVTALGESNQHVVTEGAIGLGLLRASQHITAVNSSITAMPDDGMRVLAAEALILFDDPLAQTMAEDIVTDPDALAVLENAASLRRANYQDLVAFYSGP